MRRRLGGDRYRRGPAVHGPDTNDHHERAASQQLDDDDLDHGDHQHLVVERRGALDVGVIRERDRRPPQAPRRDGGGTSGGTAGGTPSGTSSGTDAGGGGGGTGGGGATPNGATSSNTTTTLGLG